MLPELIHVSIVWIYRHILRRRFYTRNYCLLLKKRIHLALNRQRVYLKRTKISYTSIALKKTKKTFSTHFSCAFVHYRFIVVFIFWLCSKFLVREQKIYIVIFFWVIMWRNFNFSSFKIFLYFFFFFDDLTTKNTHGCY